MALAVGDPWFPQDAEVGQGGYLYLSPQTLPLRCRTGTGVFRWTWERPSGVSMWPHSLLGPWLVPTRVIRVTGGPWWWSQSPGQ